ncbi:MAG: ATP-binding cassette domain-containing protein, partial [Candidatus Brocadiia bacterium]
GKIPAVRDLNIGVEKGQIIALIGSNGAGKSTTLKGLAGVLSPNKGQIYYEEKEITKLPANHKRRRLPGLRPFCYNQASCAACV